MNRKRFWSVLLLVLALLFVGCTNSTSLETSEQLDDLLYYISGEVIDIQTQAGIEDAQVSIWKEGVELAVFSTNGLGSFATSSLEPGIYTFKITAPGYQESTAQDVEISEEMLEQITKVSFALLPEDGLDIDYSHLSGKVVDELGQPLEGALIRVDGGAITNGVFASTYTDDGGSSFEELKRLNPYTDPVLADRSHIPFTSGGFNMTPIWRKESLDLSAYSGQELIIEFEFDTVDNLYNGFRGWFIDAFKIYEAEANAGIQSLNSFVHEQRGRSRR